MTRYLVNLPVTPRGNAAGNPSVAHSTKADKTGRIIAVDPCTSYPPILSAFVAHASTCKLCRPLHASNAHSIRVSCPDKTGGLSAFYITPYPVSADGYKSPTAPTGGGAVYPASPRRLEV